MARGEVLAINGTTLSTIASGVRGWLAEGDPWRAEVETVERPAAGPAFAAPRVREREIDVVFDLRGATGGSDAARNALLGAIGWPQREPLRLRVELAGSVQGEADAVVTEIDLAAAGTLRWRVVVGQPFWQETGLVTSSLTTTSGSGSASVAVGGHAVTQPLLRISHGGTYPSNRWRYVRAVTVTNNSTRTLRAYPISLPRFDSAALVTAGKMRVDGDDIRVFANGQDLPREVVNFNTGSTQVWVVIDFLPPGESLTLYLAYGNPNPPSVAPRLTSGRYLLTRHPAFRIEGSNGTSSGSNTSTTLKDTSKSWATNEWARAKVRIYAGTGAGQERIVASNTVTQLTVTSAWTTIPNATSKYVIETSDNDRWNYYVKVSADGVFPRGMWRANKHVNRPSIITFDVPGAFRPALHTRNRDDFGQARISKLDPGSGPRYYPILNAERRVGQATRLADEGIADGVALYHPLGITTVRAGFKWQNPGGICRGVMVTREAGGETWEEVVERTDAPTSLTTIAPADYVPPETVNHLGFFVLPADGVQIGADAKPGNKAIWRIDDQLVLTIDTSLLAISALGAETEVHEIRATARVGGGSTATPPYDTLEIGGPGRYVWVASGEELAVDCAAGWARVRNASTGAVLREVPWAVEARHYESDPVTGAAVGTPAEQWLPLPPGSQTLYWSETNGGSVNVSIQRYHRYLY